MTAMFMIGQFIESRIMSTTLPSPSRGFAAALIFTMSGGDPKPTVLFPSGSGRLSSLNFGLSVDGRT